MASSSGVRRIVVGVDFGELGARALRAAISLGAATGDTEIHAVHAREVTETLGVATYDMKQTEADIESLRAHVELAIDDYKKEHGEAPPIGVSVHRVNGSPIDELVRIAAALRAGLIVVGTHGHGGIKRAVLGSVAENVVRKAHCPVLVMRAIAHPKTEELRDAVEPLCPDCEATRKAEGDANLWCPRHAEHHAHSRIYALEEAKLRGPWGFGV